MNEYLLTVIGAVLLSSVLTAVLPNGKSAGLIKTVLKLTCIFIIVAPVLKYIQAEKYPEKNSQVSIIETDSEFIQYYSEMRIKLTEESLEKELENNYQIQTKITAKWRYENGEIYIYAVNIENCDKQKEIGDFLTKKYGFEVYFG